MIDWIDPTAAATCEMDTLLMPALGVPLDAADGAIAAALVAGLVIDTANFQHPNTTPRTLRVAAELVAAGAPLYDTARRLYRTKPNRQLRLFGRVMANMGTDLEGRLVWATLTDADSGRGRRQSTSDAEGLLRPAQPIRDGRGRRPVQGSQRARRVCRSARATAASTRPI